MAETSASFHCEGKIPSLILLLNSVERGTQSESAHSFKILLLIWSGPEALVVFNLRRILWTIDGVILI